MDDLYIKLLNHLSIGASIMSPSGRTLFMNESFQQGLNESEDFLYNADLYSQHYLQKIDSSYFIRVMEEKKSIRGSQLYINESSFLYSVMLHDEPVLDESGNIIAVLACAEHILPMGRVADMGCLLHANASSAFICESPAMREILQRVNRVAKLPTNILLMGESGVGKDKLAEYIHSMSACRNGPFIVVNCAAIAENLIESELFGYERNAFTGAGREGKKGLIEEANNGTLFLDEINSLPLGLQGKVLRALETKMIRRVGGTTEHKVDFRLISASNRDLDECVKQKTFREDLYYRINVFTERIPPLRSRKEDIVPLLEYFVKRIGKQYNIHYLLTKDDVALALSYNWPGNVRELRNFAERLVIIGSSAFLQNMLVSNQDAITPRISSGTLKQQMADLERKIIQEVLKSTKSKKSAAKELGIDPAVLSRKIAKYGLRG